MNNKMALSVPTRLQDRCNMCEDDLMDARKLPCGHLYCSKCLVNHIRTNTNKKTKMFKCLECPKTHKSPSPLKLNTVQLAFPALPDTIGPRPKCRVRGHETEDVFLFCSDHKTNICAKCVIKAHKGCNHTTLTEADSTQKKGVQQLVEQVETYLRGVRERIKTSDKNYQDLHTHANKMKKEIRETVKQLTARLEEEGRRLIDDVDQLVQKADEHNIKSAQTTQENTAVRLLSSMSETMESEYILTMSHNTEAFEREWKSLYSNSLPVFSYEHNTGRKKVAGMLLGEVTAQVEKKLVGGRHQPASSRPEDRKDMTLKHKYCDVAGIVDVDNTVLAVQLEKPEIQVYSGDKLITTINIPNLRNPYPGLVYLGRDRHSGVQLVVGDSEGRALYFVTLTPDWRLHTHSRQELPYGPRRVTHDKASGQLVVLDDSNKRVYMYTPSGDLLTTVQLDKQAISEPRCAVRQGDMIVVADWDKQAVMWTDGGGKVQRVYRSTDKQRLVLPCYLTVDTDTGHVLVVDGGGHTVQEVDRRGNWVSTVLQQQDGIRKPTRVHLSDSGLLYTGYSSDGLGKIKVTDHNQHSSHKHGNFMQTKLTTKLSLYK